MKKITALEGYFDFQSSDDIRLKGHRIGIDDVLHYHLEGYSPEEIIQHLPTLTLEEIYATITYYLHYRAKIDAYLARIDKWRETCYQESQANPSPLAQKLRAIKRQRELA